LVCGEAGQVELLTGHLPPIHLLQDPLWSPGRSGKPWIAVSSRPGKPSRSPTKA